MGLLGKLFGGKVRVYRDRNGNWINSASSTNFSDIDNMQLALNSPVLGTCIDIFADYTSKVIFTEGKNDNSDFIKLLKNPNPYLSGEEFIKQFVWYLKVYGWVYQKPYTVGSSVKVLYNLNPSGVEFNKEIKKSLFYKSTDLKNVNNYSFNYNDYNTKVPMMFGDIVPFYDVANGINENPFTSPSRVDFIKKQLQNLNLGTDAENKVINKIGNAMVYKEKSKDSMQNSMPLNPKDREQIETRIDSKGVTNGNGIIATSVELGYKQTHIPYKDGGFSEMLENNIPLVTQAFGIPNEIYKAYKEGDTFTNKDSAAVQFIQSKIQPIVNNLANSYNNRFGLNELKGSLDHLPSMAEIKNKKIDSALKLSQAVRNLTQSGYSIEQATAYLEDLGIKTIDNE